MNETISAFIDDELTIAEKIELVERLGQDESYAGETLSLLCQETRLRSEVVHRVPEVDFAKSYDWKRFLTPLFQPLRLATAALAATVIILLFSYPSPEAGPILNRFVIYRPDVSRVDITGSFTDWQRMPMQKLGGSGYWEIRLPLPAGEHRYTYILEGGESMADPTVSTMERDDFGGHNSILYAEQNI